MLSLNAVDRAYRAKPFAGDTDRLAFLFDLYGKITASPAPLLPEEKKSKRKTH